MAFKVGDKVRVICDDPRYGWGKVRKGDVGVVAVVAPDVVAVVAPDLAVDFPAQALWSASQGELELVEELPEEDPRVDWFEAPEGTTHRYIGTDRCTYWLKQIGDTDEVLWVDDGAKFFGYALTSLSASDRRAKAFPEICSLIARYPQGDKPVEKKEQPVVKKKVGWWGID
jgi:hypothetical protein